VTIMSMVATGKLSFMAWVKNLEDE
jgi:hypothetical protein